MGNVRDAKRAFGWWVVGFHLLLIGLMYRFAPTKDEHWPAWIQAFGSVWAVMAAVGVGAWQVTLNQVAQRQVAEAASREVAFLAYDSLHFLIRNGHEKLVGPKRYEICEVEFRELLDRIAWARKHIDSPEDFRDLYDIRHHLSEGAALFRANDSNFVSVTKEDIAEMRRHQRDLALLANQRTDQRHPRRQA